MTNILIFILGLALCVQAFIGLTFFISSIQEKEKRASTLGAVQFFGMLVLVILFFVLNAYDFFNSGVGFGIMIALLIVGVVGLILLFSRIGANQKALKGTKGLIVGEVKRWDERKIQFSNMIRMMVTMMKMGPPPGAPGPDAPPPPPPSTDRAIEFGGPGGPPPPEALKMAKNLTDEEMNASGLGPLAPPDKTDAEGIAFPPNASMGFACATMPTIWAWPEKYAPTPAGAKWDISPKEASIRVKGFTKSLGAVSVGITEIDPKWIYSHRGVSGVHLKEWGKELQLDHKYAIVFTEEMDFETVGAAPHTPTFIESMKNYAKGAFIAAQIANFIAYMGYSARANNVSTYDVNLVPMAVDAGLGELSRMGYLITKEKGPRVRLCAVTTDLPLVPDKPVDIGVKHFCTICKKCSRCCPSQSIPNYDEPKEVNGSLRWKLNDETCFGYWQKVATDCAVCMRVCPWSHARTFPHKLIVNAVSRNRFSRSLFSLMDDIFYGKRPKAKAPPKWAQYTMS
jgi:hypothetical protein